MNNCLVSKLKSKVDNPHLPILNGLFLECEKVDDKSPNTILQIGAKPGESVIAEIVSGNANFSDGTKKWIVPVSTEKYSPTNQISGSGPFRIIIYNKYGLSGFGTTSLRSSGMVFASELSEFYSIKELRFFTTLGAPMPGEMNIEKMDWSKIIYCVCNQRSMNGSILSFSNSTNCQEIYIMDSNVTGSINELAEALKNTHVAGNLLIRSDFNGVTYNGATFLSKTITFDGNGNYTISDSQV